MFCAVSFGNRIVGNIEVEHPPRHPHIALMETSGCSCKIDINSLRPSAMGLLT